MVVGLIQENREFECLVDSVQSRALYAQYATSVFVGFTTDASRHTVYAPLICRVLADWQEPVLYVALDTTMLWEFCVLRLSLVYRGRAIPLVWRVLNHASSVSFYTYRRLLERVDASACGCEVVLLVRL